MDQMIQQSLVSRPRRNLQEGLHLIEGKSAERNKDVKMCYIAEGDTLAFMAECIISQNIL